MLDRILSALVALSLAFLVWLYARSRDQEILDDVPVPVHLVLTAAQANNYLLAVDGPCQVPVTFTGQPARIHELQGQLQRGEFRIDVPMAIAEDRAGESYFLDTARVDAGDIHTPHGVRATVVEGRNRIPVTVHRLIRRQLPVRFDYGLDPRVSQVTVEPPTVEVVGPQEVLDRMPSLPTVAYPLAAHLGSGPLPQALAVGPVPLLQEVEGRHLRTSSPSVMVRLSLRPAMKVYDLDVPISFLCPENFPLRPRFNGDDRAGKLSLKVQGPAAAEPPVVYAIVDLTRRKFGKFETGLYSEEVRVQLPKDFELAQPPPKEVSIWLEDPADPATKPRKSD